MRKLGYVFAAIGALAIAAPSIASAETVVIKRDGYHQSWNDRWHHGWNARAEMRRDRGWHSGWRHHPDRVVIVKKHRYY
ncbi:hypothetical protein ACFFWD_10040 [Bradyrhizobium erythrophlei]|uniref:hypothetical protein n=1 Tax=Bradyrhizobium erythrophlei TaxID=1437360 RepID=UPI0035E4825A